MASIRPTWRITLRVRGVSILSVRLVVSPSPDQHNSTSTFSTTSVLSKKSALPPRPTLDDSTITHVYLKGSGPGGQKINKTNSAVQITHHPTGIVVKSQATRSRSQNYAAARRILAEKVDVAVKGEQSYTSLKNQRKAKKKASGEKKRRRKYRALDEAKGAGKEGVEEEEGDEFEDANEDEEEVEEEDSKHSVQEVRVTEGKG